MVFPVAGFLAAVFLALVFLEEELFPDDVVFVAADLPAAVFFLEAAVLAELPALFPEVVLLEEVFLSIVSPVFLSLVISCLL